MTDMSTGPELTPEQLEAIEARVEAATPGPWTHDSEECRGRINNVVGDGYHVADGASDIDAAFIAAARTDVPLLCQEVRRLRAVVAAKDANCDMFRRIAKETAFAYALVADAIAATSEGPADLAAKAKATRAERDAMEDEIDEWRSATGLLRGGDPGAVTPADLSRETQSKSRLLFEVRDHLRLVLGELAGNTLETSTELLLARIERETDAE